MTEEQTQYDASKFPWPQRGDKLFIAGNDWWHNACLNFMSTNDWDAYIVGYKTGADVIVDHLKKNRSDLDLMIYPVCFLYRQYLELSMKRLIHRGSVLLSITPTFLQIHDLEKLWMQCRQVLEQIEPTSREDFDTVQEQILEFSQIDPASTAFRYPVDKNDNPSIPKLKHINVRNMADVMSKIYSFLDGASAQIEYFIEIKEEMNSEGY
jgi:hypothetical protein